MRDIDVLRYFQTSLGVGVITIYPNITTVKLVINKGDIKDVIIPMIESRGYYLLTTPPDGGPNTN